MLLLQKSYKHWVFAWLIEDTALSQFSASSMSAMFVGLSSPQLSMTDETWQFLSLSRLSKADIIKRVLSCSGVYTTGVGHWLGEVEDRREANVYGA